MATLTAWRALETWARTNWTATELRFENEALNPPQDANGVPKPFVMLEVSSDVTEQDSIGAGSVAANLWRERGVALFHVFVPSGTGTAAMRQHAENLMLALRGLKLTPGITVEDISMNFGDPGQRDANWFFMTVAAAWVRDF